MHLFYKFVTILALFRLVPAVHERLRADYQSICGLNGRYLRNNVKKIMDSFQNEDSIEFSDHSKGVYVHKELCKSCGVTSPFNSLTIYISDDNYIFFINFPVSVDPKESAKSFGLTSVQTVLPIDVSFTVVWIRSAADFLNSSLKFKISYNSSPNGKQKIIESSNYIQELSQNEDQILLVDIQTTKTQNRIQSFDISSFGKNQFDFTARDSYLILCYSSEPNCEPILISKYGITCDCEVTEQMATILIVMFFWLICCLTATHPIFMFVTDKGKEDRTDFPMTISCGQKTAKFEYIIGIRITKTTSDFDLTDVNVDIEFMSDTNESIAPVFRFPAKVLEKHLLTNIRIFMWRLTKLPELKKVNCCHSGPPDGRIILFGVYVFNRKDQEYKLYRINKGIGRENRSFKMILLKDDKGEDEMIEAEEVQLKSLNLQINYSFLELVWIFFVNISLIGLIAAILLTIYPSSLYIEMTVRVLICSCAALVFNFLFTKVYQWMLLAELKQQTKMNSKYEKTFFVTIKVYYVISILFSFLFGLYVGFQNTGQKTIETFQWVCVIFCATALFAFLWEVFYIISNFCSKSRAPTEASEEEKTISSMGSTY